MSGIEFLFSFYSLLLGLAVANVVTGFAESWQMRARTSLGLSTLLLGLLILFRAAQQWLSVSGASATLTMDAWNVLTSMGMALPYIFISRAMLPREHDNCTHLDDYYLQNSRALMLALLVPPAVSLARNVAVFGLEGMPVDLFAVKYGIPLLVPVALLFSRHQWHHRVGLTLLVVLIVVLMLLS